jgi:LacI family transcriptional regulator, repressor for deo operon, udp, cdd, tsx, nupC, and nupG
MARCFRSRGFPKRDDFWANTKKQVNKWLCICYTLHTAMTRSNTIQNNRNTITIRDIASSAGVSIGTVSRALKNQPGLTEETRQQVLEIATRLGYDIGNLRQSKVRRVSFLSFRLPDLPVNPFYSHVLHGVEEACREQDIVLSFISFRPGDRLTEIVRRHEADGLLCVGYFEPKHLEQMVQFGVPLVLIDHHVTGFSCVNMDNFNGAYQAVHHLVEQGRKRIAFISGPSHYSSAERVRGFRQALFDAGIPADPALEVLRDPVDSHFGTRIALDRLMALKNPPDAVFCYNDLSALVGIEYALECGIRVPEDLAFVGFDDIDAAPNSKPPLTTVRVNKEALGQRGLEVLLNNRANPDSIIESFVEAELVIRESSQGTRQSSNESTH